MNKWAVLWDCDGVLVDSEPVMAVIAAKVLNGMGLAAESTDFAPYVGMGEDVYIGDVVKKYGGNYNEKVKNTVYQAYIDEAGDILESFPGALELRLSLRKKGFRQAVASSADLMKVEANLKGIGLCADDFEAVITGSDIRHKKPDPEIYLLAAKKLGADPRNCIVIEDATAGVASGKAAGMYTIAYVSSCSREELLDAGADAVLDNYGEIREAISEYTGVKLDD